MKNMVQWGEQTAAINSLSCALSSPGQGSCLWHILHGKLLTNVVFLL